LKNLFLAQRSPAETLKIFIPVCDLPFIMTVTPSGIAT